MKKFSLLPGLVLTASVVIVFLISCQKEQNADPVEPVATGSESVVGIAGSGSFAGSISNEYAEALKNNFVKKHEDDDQAYRVAFSAKDLVAFIQSLQKKNHSDIIYVNFGIYGKGAPAPKSKDNGNITVFFTGNKIGKASNVKTDGALDELVDQNLNHGEMLKP